MNRLNCIACVAFGLAALLLLSLGGSPVMAQEEEPIAKVHAPGIPPSDYHLARNTLVEIELMDTLDTAGAARNDTFSYRVLHDVSGEGGVVVRANQTGKGLVLESRKNGRFGPARLHLGFGEVPSVEGRGVKLGFTLAALKANRTIGPYQAVLGGYFQGEGEHVRLDAGTRIVTAVEFPYGTRRIMAGEEGARYRLFSTEPVREPQGNR